MQEATTNKELVLYQRCIQLLYIYKTINPTVVSLEEIEGKDIKEKLKTLRTLLKQVAPKTEIERKKDIILQMICEEFESRKPLYM